MAVAVSLPRTIVERARKQAERLGLSLEEYLVELVVQDLDPRDRVLEYVEAARELLEEAREELGRGDIRQSAERVWGSAALAVKAYAEYREGRRLASHRELWLYKDRVAQELGRWVKNAWNAANSMHTCFYEGWCTREDVEEAVEQVEKLIEEIGTRVKGAR